MMRGRLRFSALVFLGLACAGEAAEPVPRLEPAKMHCRLALHGGGEVTLPQAQVFRKLADLPGRKLKLYVPDPPVSDVWEKADFVPVTEPDDAEVVWLSSKPGGDLGTKILHFYDQRGLLGLSGGAVKWFENEKGLPNASVLLPGDPVPDLSLATPLAYRLPAGTGLFFKGRSVKVAGPEPVEALALKERRFTIPPGPRADHFSLVRASRALILDADFPPKEMPAPRVEKGKLILIGGGATPGAALDELIRDSGGKSGHIVVIPTAEGAFPKKEQKIVEWLRERGAGRISIVHAKTISEADSAEFAAKIDVATGVWFGGGRQWRLVDRYFGTRTHKALNRLLDRGGVICGTSAGATICGEYLVRGDPLGSRTMMAAGYERGLDFLPGVAIDQHFSQRNRFPDMIALKSRYPQLLGIGIDEVTAAIVSGDQLRVVGRGKVFVYPAADPKERIDLEKHDIFSFSDRKVLP